MVDFQSRDRTRDLGDDDDEQPDEEPVDEQGEDEPSDEQADGRDHDHDHDHDHAEEGHHAHDLEDVGTAVVTVSSSRTLDDDPAGDAIAEAMRSEGKVVTRERVPDDHDRVQAAVDNLVDRSDVDVVVTTGGTGVTPDDVTVEAVEPLFEKGLPGFGELFRILSHEDVGTKVVATRATAGIARGTEGGVPVFCLPGSENAARLGAERIISEEAAHLAGLASRE